MRRSYATWTVLVTLILGVGGLASAPARAACCPTVVAGLIPETEVHLGPGAHPGAGVKEPTTVAPGRDPAEEPTAGREEEPESPAGEGGAEGGSGGGAPGTSMPTQPSQVVTRHPAADGDLPNNNGGGGHGGRFPVLLLVGLAGAGALAIALVRQRA